MNEPTTDAKWKEIEERLKEHTCPPDQPPVPRVERKVQQRRGEKDVNVNVIQKVEEGVERTAIPPLAATHGSEVEPLKSVEWQFPLGGCHARLTIVAAPENEIQPEDMDALREMAALIKRQLERRGKPKTWTPQETWFGGEGGDA